MQSIRFKQIESNKCVLCCFGFEFEQKWFCQFSRVWIRTDRVTFIEIQQGHPTNRDQSQSCRKPFFSQNHLNHSQPKSLSTMFYQCLWWHIDGCQEDRFGNREVGFQPWQSPSAKSRQEIPTKFKSGHKSCFMFHSPFYYQYVRSPPPPLLLNPYIKTVKK